MELNEIYEEASCVFPCSPDAFPSKEQTAYVRGFLAGFKARQSSEVKTDFFERLATGLHNLWPPGEKDGKYAWRDSVPNLVKRLKLLWEIRELKEYSLDECLSAGRRYLNQFTDNAKYMKTLKYFILRQNERTVGKDGKIHYMNQSTFADMLESQSSLEVQEDWETAFESSSTFDQGEIV